MLYSWTTLSTSLTNDNFIRYCPNYHPYYLRLYYGILFWIQCLRARRDARCLGFADSAFLDFFTTTFPPESLPVCGPLMLLFQSLCTSKPEIKSFGLVVPDLPSKPGPTYRHEFMQQDINSFLPNIPGIFALIRDLYDTIHDDSEGRVYPNLGCHTPVPPGANEPIQFGFCNFPILAQRNDFEKYALCSPGLQYPCEAYKGINRSFYEKYNSIPFPALHADDKLAEFPAFLHLDGSPKWFVSIVLIAAKAAKFFEESGFLSDCSPKGLPINQYVCNIQRPDTLPIAPRYSADPSSLIQFSLQLSTTVRKPIPLIKAMAASCQTRIKMYHQHPYFGAFGEPVGTGPFWDIRPVETSSIDINSYLSYVQIIKEMLKDDIKRSRTC
ncbi:IAA-leucine resistant 2 [Papaver somniferum]|uniref:IAA-leucine resistant 2 n=1 Tax=Papaver somniferum TaxID=3469 RepID=UPI000E7044B2|nr:IAA-leucine resistant 2 [Papaver somniferum]XP_026379757.1 IAA-leucine resistant 2 [Papaver somniferum]XP_026379758.1 IAA-leucine resistant 2 [Papaver somniferum]